MGDACDPDDDGDGWPDGEDACPFVPDPGQADSDGDGAGDSCDPDDDQDGTPDLEDSCPYHPEAASADLDGDGLGDACDPDPDGDGVPSAQDCAPLDPTTGASEAVEACNGVDDDCDDATDEAPAAGCTFYGFDADGDGLPAPDGEARCLCAPTPPFTGLGSEVADADDLVFGTPCGEPEPEDPPELVCHAWWPDLDGDGFGDAGTAAACLCGPPEGLLWAANGTDCVDASLEAHPGATGWFALPRPDGGFDYDCDGTQTPKSKKLGGLCTLSSAGECGGVEGWRTPVPGCGAAGTWQVGCQLAGGEGGAPGCVEMTEKRLQTCR
jgi:hypothetical protein